MKKITIDTPYTAADIKVLQQVEVKQNKDTFYLHCAHCLELHGKGKIGKGQSPAEALSYIAASVPITVNGKKIAVAAVFCKLCDRLVWSSKHLTGLY